MESINKELADKLHKLAYNVTSQNEMYMVIEKFFYTLPPIYYEKIGCKPCWRCHGTGTNEGMT